MATLTTLNLSPSRVPPEIVSLQMDWSSDSPERWSFLESPLQSHVKVRKELASVARRAQQRVSSDRFH